MVSVQQPYGSEVSSYGGQALHNKYDLIWFHLCDLYFIGVYSEFLVKCQSSFTVIVMCINNIFTIFLLPKILPCVQKNDF